MAKNWSIPDFDPDMPLSSCLRQVMRTRCLELFSVTQGLRDGAAGAVHDARITSRRLLVLYGVFKDCLKKKKLKRFKIRIKSLHKLIGKVREHDVQMSFLRKYLKPGIHHPDTAEKDRPITPRPKPKPWPGWMARWNCFAT